MAKTFSADVVVVGGGPVGLTLAIDLAQRGASVVVVERRPRGEPPSVKCNHVSARSMELFRQLGLSATIRNSGLPADYPHDVAYRTTMTGRELARIPIPCRHDRFSATNGPDTDWPTAEPPHRINQIYLEPILFAAASTAPGITIINDVDYQDFDEDAEGVRVRVRRLSDGASIEVRGRFLVGCDGGRSRVREQIGATLGGDAIVQRVQSTYIRAPKLIDLMTTERAWGNFSLNPRRTGNVYAIDGKETWIVHNYLRDSEADFESVDRDYAIRQILGVDADFKYHVLGHEDWYGRRLVADRLRKGRAFICGDAAHLWVPYAGYGMNAGLADAANLAWMLAATIAGWGGEALLDAHEQERLPITEQVSHYAMNHAHAMAKQRGAVPADIEDDTDDGDLARRRLGEAAYDLNVQQYCCSGLNFGYYYDESSIIAYDGGAHPAYSMGSYTPASVPGCRTPFFVLSDGRGLYDVLGRGFALLRFDPAADVAPLVLAAAQCSVPLTVCDLSNEAAPPSYGHGLLISRPDQHVAWRGDAAPRDAEALIRKITGRPDSI